MFRSIALCGVAVALVLSGPAFAQEVEERPDAGPAFGSLVGGLIGGAIGAAVTRRGAPRGADLIPGAGGPHLAGGKAGAGGGAHKGGAGAPMRKKPGK